MFIGDAAKTGVVGASVARPGKHVLVVSNIVGTIVVLVVKHPVMRAGSELTVAVPWKPATNTRQGGTPHEQTRTHHCSTTPI